MHLGVHRDKVPRWSKAAFQDKFNIMKGKLESGTATNECESGDKYSELDSNLARLQRRLREGSALDTGQRGSNKVSALAEGLFPKEEAAVVSKESSSTVVPTASKKGSSETCHFCSKRVYVVERMSAEGRFFHRSCFRCDYCGILLRLGGYVHHREGPFEGECKQFRI